jgi:hypothetical protein
MSEKNNPRTGGLFGIDLIPGVDIQDFLPPVVKDAIKNVTGVILDPDDNSINIGDPQPEGERPIPVEPGTEEMSSTVKALDAMISAANLLLKLGFLIPDQLEGPLRLLVGALGTIRGWLD